MSLLGWIFGRRSSNERVPARRALANELSHWRIVEVTNDSGVRVVARTRLERPDLPNLPAFTTAVSVSWSYESADGFPDTDTKAAMDRFEIAMDDLSDCDFSYLIQVRTGLDERAWLYYTADLEQFMRQLQARALSVGSPPIRAEATDDPDWARWSALVQETPRGSTLMGR